MDQQQTAGKETPSPRPWQRGISVFIATGAWIGFVPLAPGTFGTLWGLPLAWAITQIPQPAIQIAVIVAICLIGIPLCSRATVRLGGKKDPGSIVFDEIASVPITFFLVPAAMLGSPWVLFAGFVLFRIADISKVPPARQLESLPDGLGIMADDWIAGVYSCLLLHLLIYADVFTAGGG